MKLCCQVVTLDVAVADSVTTYQGSLDQNFGDLTRLGYDSVELMALNPGELDWEEVEGIAGECGVSIALVCTRELFGQLGLNYTSPEEEIHGEAIKRAKEVINFARYPGTNINIGWVRGQYCARPSHEQTEGLAVKAFRELADYAAPGSVIIALETMTIMQTSFTNTLAEGARMVERVDRSNLRLTMDVFHLGLEEKDLHQTIRDYNKYSVHIHLVDNNHRYPGHCGPDFEKILTTFRECGYDGNFCTEVFQIPSMKEAARGVMACLGPIAERVYGKKVADRSGI